MDYLAGDPLAHVLGDMGHVIPYVPKTENFNGTSEFLEGTSGVSAGSAFHLYWEGYIGAADGEDTIINFTNTDFSGYCSLYVSFTGTLSLYMADNSNTELFEVDSGVSCVSGYHAIHWFASATNVTVVVDGTTVIDETISSTTYNLDADVWVINGIMDGYGQLPCDMARCVLHTATLDATNAAVRARYQRTDNVGVRPSISEATDGAGDFDIWERETGDIAGDVGEQAGNVTFDFTSLVGP